MWELQHALAEVSGLPHVSLQPSAGSHGELAGVLLTRAYHEDRGEHRHKVLAPGHVARHQPGDGDDGRLRGRQGRRRTRTATSTSTTCAPRRTTDVACLMLTNPSTLGLFETQHRGDRRASSTTSARRSTTTARTSTRSWARPRPGDMGFDIVHFNLHKSFTQPHGGGGPGSGPIAVSDRIEPFLPRPQVVRARTSGNGTARSFDLDFDRPKSIGRLRGFQGNFGVFVRSYAYILSLGGDGLTGGVGDRGPERQLPAGAAQGARAGEHLPVAYDRLCMHEFVLSGAPMKRQLGIAHDSTSPSGCSTSATTRRRSTSRSSSTRR